MPDRNAKPDNVIPVSDGKEAVGAMALRMSALAMTPDSAHARSLLARVLTDLCRQAPDPVQALRDATGLLAEALRHTERVWAEASEIAEAGGR
jgi:hypothetical protein